MCWTFCFVRTKHGNSSVGTLIVKQNNMERRKPNMPCMKVPSILENWCFMRSVSKTNCGTIVL